MKRGILEARNRYEQNVIFQNKRCLYGCNEKSWYKNSVPHVILNTNWNVQQQGYRLKGL